MIDFIITVDTEADNQWKAKNRGENLKLENIYQLSRFQSLCQKYGFKPTYLVTYEVASDRKSVDILKPWQDNNLAEIGSHLHPWSTPPFKNQKEKVVNSFPSGLSHVKLDSKLKSLTNKITESFNKKPISFRAGRWGFNNAVALALVKNGYLVDCSITPRVNWQNLKNDNNIGAPNFINFTSKPFIYNFDNGNLLEVPMTIVYNGFMSQNNWLLKYFAGLPNSFFKRVFNKLIFQLTWCRIRPDTKIKSLKKIYSRALLNNLPVIEFMIHSSELIAGGSPSTKTREQAEQMYQKLEEFFIFLKQKKVNSVTLNEFYNKFI